MQSTGICLRAKITTHLQINWTVLFRLNKHHYFEIKAFCNFSISYMQSMSFLTDSEQSLKFIFFQLDPNFNNQTEFNINKQSCECTALSQIKSLRCLYFPSWFCVHSLSTSLLSGGRFPGPSAGWWTVVVSLSLAGSSYLASSRVSSCSHVEVELYGSWEGQCKGQWTSSEDFSLSEQPFLLHRFLEDDRDCW